VIDDGQYQLHHQYLGLMKCDEYTLFLIRNCSSHIG
jgi:hypothetical protein